MNRDLNQKPRLLVFPGWGISGEALRPLLNVLDGFYQIELIDYAQCPLKYLNSPEDFLNHVIPNHTGDLHCLGWSLGGMLTIKAALMFPSRIASVITLASNLQFVASDNWPYGISTQAWDDFETLFLNNPARALKRFVLMQTNSREHAAILIEHINNDNLVSQKTLSWLKTFKLQTKLSKLSCPLLSILGKNDLLVSAGLSDYYLQENNTNIRCGILDNADHAVFLSHAAEVVEFINYY